MSKRLPLFLAAIALLGLLALLATIALRLYRAAPGPAPELRAVTLFPQPRALPDFNLRQSDGTALVPGELKGHWTLVFIGFTHCPDVCPTQLAQLSVAQKQWRALPDSTRPRLLFVSVDPERDTPDRIGEYAHGFDPDTLAATADIPALEAFAKSLSLVFAKMPAPEGAPADEYSVDHSAAIAVLDPQGRMAGVIQPPLDPNAIAKDMIALTNSVVPAKAGTRAR